MELWYAFDALAPNAERIMSAVLQKNNPNFSREVLVICWPLVESSPADGECPLLEGGRPGFLFWEEEQAV